jgi:hypothetical protein
MLCTTTCIEMCMTIAQRAEAYPYKKYSIIHTVTGAHANEGRLTFPNLIRHKRHLAGVSF